jgi:hypothetical protein
LIQVVPQPDLHYFEGRAALLLAGVYSVECPAGAKVGLSRDQLRHYVRAQAEHDARFGGNATRHWLASDAEFVARQVPKPLHDELQTTYLETFRATR